MGGLALGMTVMEGKDDLVAIKNRAACARNTWAGALKG
jgi:hypothetical protein